MPQVSKNPLKEDTYKKIFILFLETLNSIDNKSNLSIFLKELLTPIEQIMLSKRIVISYLLEKGYNYNEIMETLHVSSSTVSRVNLIYANSTVMRSTIKKIVKRKKFKGLLLDIGITISSFGDVPKSETKVWKNLKRSLKESRNSKI